MTPTERSRGSGWEPLALGASGMLLALIAVGASAINSRSSGSTVVSGPVWIGLTGLAMLAGAGAVVAWATGSRRLRPGPFIGAAFGIAALLGSPVEALAVRPHPVRAELIGVDPASGRRLWSARPPLLAVSGALTVDPDGSLVADGPDASSRCGGSLIEVRLDPRTGRQRGPATPGGTGPLAPYAVATDGTTTYELASGSSGEELRATAGGSVRWEATLVPGPPPMVSIGAGVVVVDTYVRGGVVAPPFAVPAGKAGAYGLRVLDAASGQDLWGDGSGANVGAAVAAGAVWVLDPGGSLVRHEARTGAVLATASVDLRSSTLGAGIVPPLWSVADRLVTSTSSGELVGLGPDGRAQWRLPVPTLGSGTISVFGAGPTLVAAVDGRAASGCGGE